DRVCFNVEDGEGGHVSRSFGETGIEGSYYNVLREFWRLAAAAPGKFGFIREIDDATRLVLRPNEAAFFNQLVEPFAITSMDWAGKHRDLFPGIAWIEERRLRRLYPWQHQSRQADRHGGGSSPATH